MALKLVTKRMILAYYIVLMRGVFIFQRKKTDASGEIRANNVFSEFYLPVTFESFIALVTKI